MKTQRNSNCPCPVLLFLIVLSTQAFLGFTGNSCAAEAGPRSGVLMRTRLLINEEWRFIKGDPPNNPTDFSFDAVKSQILPSGNEFLKDPSKRFKQPERNLDNASAYATVDYDDASWRRLDLPHDYAVEGPFTTAVSGSTGRLTSSGVVWYRKQLVIPASDSGKSLFLDIDGAMSYTMVWLNGRFVGGWPYGYASFRLNLTPYVKPGEKNVLAIRLDNPVPKDADWRSASSRWYPGAGIYRNVWLVKTSPVHISQWGTFLTTPKVSRSSASVTLKTSVDNDSKYEKRVAVATQIYAINQEDKKLGSAVATIAPVKVSIPAGQNRVMESEGTIPNPKLWGTGLHQQPNRYVAVTTVRQEGKIVDVYETPFGVRTLRFAPNEGFFLNGEHLKLNGVCDHHDLGALGSAVNYRALQRQLEILADMGVNAIRTSHNPPAPELLDLADKMGFLIMDEAFDVWVQQKVAYDYHLLYADWHEQDLRALLRRDRNHPSVILWSVGNEIGEQTAGAKGAAMAEELVRICHEEDSTRLTISGMNSAPAGSPFPVPIDTIGLNYQGVGIYNMPAQYPIFHKSYPDKFIVGTETASTLSSRGIYTFPVVSGMGAVASAAAGEEPDNRQVSSYDLYYTHWSYSPDKEFAAQDTYPFVGGEFVWTGFDYLGEPTPFDASRSSYFGIVDLAGFKKDRFFLYQAYWRPDHPMAHILPHWTWPDRKGLVTPVHVYTSGDEAELFLNGKSLGRKKKAPFEYRLRWDDVVYEPGELRVAAYKNGKLWATDSVKTVGAPGKLLLVPDRAAIANNGGDLSFLTLQVADDKGQTVPRSMNPIHFEVSGPGEIVATDNGDPTDMTAFPSADRKAFNGLALVIVRAKQGQHGRIVVTAKSEGLDAARAEVLTQ